MAEKVGLVEFDSLEKRGMSDPRFAGELRDHSLGQIGFGLCEGSRPINPGSVPTTHNLVDRPAKRRLPVKPVEPPGFPICPTKWSDPLGNQRSTKKTWVVCVHTLQGLNENGL